MAWLPPRLCMGEEQRDGSPTSHPWVSRLAGGTGQPPWLLQNPCPLRPGLWDNSRWWAGQPWDLLPHLTVLCLHMALGYLTSSTGGAQYRWHLWGPREGVKWCEGFTLCGHPTTAANWENFQSSIISIQNFLEVKMWDSNIFLLAPLRWVMWIYTNQWV